MSEPNIEELVTYLSSKFNRIFVDREFVCCVSNDFHRLQNKNKCRVLVFPTLGPVYQRALKYQAEAFDFATFELSTGLYKTIAVCQKDHILKKEKLELRQIQEKTMSCDLSVTTQDSAGRRKRPERQLYVPPAQRRLSSNKETETEIKQINQSKCSLHNVKPLKIAGTQNKPRRESNGGIKKKKSSNQEKIVNNDIINVSEQGNASDYSSLYIPSLMDLIMLDLISLPTYNMMFIVNGLLSPSYFHECSCGFYQYLSTRYKNDLKLGISVFHINNHEASQPSKDRISWWTFFPNTPLNNPISKVDSTTLTLDLPNQSSWNFNFNNNLTINQDKLCSKIQMMYSSDRSKVLQFDSVSDSSDIDIIFKENCAISENQRFSCDSELFENIVDLTEFNMGHYFKIKISEDEHFHACCGTHDVKNCYMEVKRDLLIKTRELIENDQVVESISDAHQSRDTCTEKKKEPKVKKISDVIKISEVKSKPVKSAIKFEATKKIMEKKKKCQHDEEIEIMRKTKENINRKTRPLMKYSDDSDDLLRIDKQDNVNNWEDLFDDDGQIQEELLTEIVHKVGKDMTIVKASEDYTPYMPKPTDELDHVVEIYNFPSSLTTGDIIHAFSMFDSDSMYVQWVDETHALLVLGSSSQAQKAVEVKNPFIKVRPMSSASVVATAAAGRYDLKPAMKRPQTNLQTARRLITSHLGTKSRVTKEQSALEKENLRKAREQKKLIKQNEKDAWEGNIH